MDFEKMFDTVPRELIYRLARASGMPEQILSAYQRSQEELRIRNVIGGMVGNRYKADLGIPQGDPLSVMFAALIMRPWAVMMRDKG